LRALTFEASGPAGAAAASTNRGSDSMGSADGAGDRRFADGAISDPPLRAAEQGLDLRRARAPGKARSTPKLLAGLTIVALALANGLIAAGAYRFAADGLERQWGETVRDAVVKSRLWLTAAARTLSATGSAVAEAGDVGARCQSLLARALAEGAEFRGIRVDLSDGRVCARAVDATNAELVADAAVRLRAATKFDLAPGVALSLAGLAPPAARLLAVKIDAAPADASNARMTALVDPRLLAQAIELDRGESGIVALMSRDDQVVAASDLTSLDVDWLPATAAPIGPVFASLATASRGGGHFVYATQAILGDDLYVLGRLSDPARIPFLALAVAPVLLVLVCLAWASARRSDLMREVDAIKAAVLGRKAAKGVSLAPEGEQISPALRELAAAYNEMARESAAREQSLQVSLAENEHLLRELNHRVKSSLQIIQSYVSLTRRLDRQSGRQTGAAAIARPSPKGGCATFAFANSRRRSSTVLRASSSIATWNSWWTPASRRRFPSTAQFRSGSPWSNA